MPNRVDWEVGIMEQSAASGFFLMIALAFMAALFVVVGLAIAAMTHQVPL